MAKEACCSCTHTTSFELSYRGHCPSVIFRIFSHPKKKMSIRHPNSYNFYACHANMTQIFAYWNAYPYCFMHCGSSFKFINSGIWWFLYMVSLSLHSGVSFTFVYPSHLYLPTRHRTLPLREYDT